MARIAGTLILAVLATLLFLAAAPPAVETTSGVIELQFPDLGEQRYPEGEVQLPHVNLNRVRIYVHKSARDVGYNILSKINTESANIIMNSVASAEGIVCNLDLGLRPGFRLGPGRNSIEVSAKDRSGKIYYASFLVQGGRIRGTPADFEITTALANDPSDNAPPEILLLEPGGGVELPPANFPGGRRPQPVKVRGYVSDDKKLAKLTISNAAVVLGSPQPGDQPTFKFEKTLMVGPEASDIVLEALDGVGNRQTLKIPIFREPPLRIEGERYAVIVGVSKYKFDGQGIHNLNFADRDALAMRDFLLSPAGGSFPKENILVLTNAEATVQNVRTALFTFLARTKPEDLVVIYFAGHGSPDPNDMRNLYLLTHDTDPANMGGTAFPMWQMEDVFSRVIKAKRIVTFTDACHSGGIGAGTLATQRHNLVNQYLQKYSGLEGRAVMTASDVSEFSQESARWGGGHGVFTFFLLEGLSGKADRNGDRLITAGELFEYVQARVREATETQQNPRALPGLARGLPLSRAAGATHARLGGDILGRRVSSN